MDVLGFPALVVGGFTACAEFGSYAFVHPVIRRLPGHISHRGRAGACALQCRRGDGDRESYVAGFVLVCAAAAMGTLTPGRVG
jgi:hypothetical protein